jgi:hypothetical protein
MIAGQTIMAMYVQKMQQMIAQIFNLKEGPQVWLIKLQGFNDH